MFISCSAEWNDDRRDYNSCANYLLTIRDSEFKVSRTFIMDTTKNSGWDDLIKCLIDIYKEKAKEGIVNNLYALCMFVDKEYQRPCVEKAIANYPEYAEDFKKLLMIE